MSSMLGLAVRWALLAVAAYIAYDIRLYAVKVWKCIWKPGLRFAAHVVAKRGHSCGGRRADGMCGRGHAPHYAC
eukprot:366094-Chlamydomonas_euryale.AAC.7